MQATNKILLGEVQHDSFGLSCEYSSEVFDRVRKLMNEDLSPVVNRMSEQEGMDKSIANNIRIEFLRFVAVRQEYSGMLVPSELVDRFWHTFILYTEDYTEFCQRHLGVYMHHRPNDHAKSKNSEMNLASARTKKLLTQMFPGHDKSMWVNSAICTDEGDCGCP